MYDRPHGMRRRGKGWIVCIHQIRYLGNLTPLRGRPPTGSPGAPRRAQTPPAAMDLRDTLLRVFESADPASALRALAGGDRCAVWVHAKEGSFAAWPEDAAVSAPLRDEALRAAGPAVHPLSPTFPEDAARHPGASALLLPVRNGSAEGRGAVVLIGAGDVQPGAPEWMRVAAALAHVGE